MEILYEGYNSDRGPSAAIWGDLPVDNWSRGLGGVFLHDDFINSPTVATGAATGQYLTFLDTGCTWGQGVGQFGNAVHTHDGTAADAVGIQWGGTAGAGFQIAASAPLTLAFECRIKKSEVATNGIGLFVGLAYETAAVDNFLVDTTGALISDDTIGFHVPMGTSGATCNWVYRAAGQTMQTAKAAAHTFVADTFVKLGFKVNGRGYTPGQRVTCYVNGVALTSFITDTNIAAATFPSAVQLSPICYSKNGSGSVAGTVQMDWWRCGTVDR